MKYWEAILREVLEKDDHTTQFVYTNVGDIKQKKRNSRMALKPEASKVRRPRVKHIIYDDSPDIYFTKREAQCMALLMNGHTIASAAAELELSPRTVEYYLKNMKMKLSCRSKYDLVRKIQETNFLDNYWHSKNENSE